MTKVAICIPSSDLLHADFAMALAALTYGCGRFVHDGVVHEAIQIALINTKGSLVVNNRNKLVEEAQQLGVDYLFFMDSDMVIPPGTLRRFLRHDKHIVGATYIQREAPHRLLGKARDGVMLDQHIQGVAIDTEEPMEVGALPGGCLLIKMDVFVDMTKPYFRTPAHEADGDGPAWIEGEDYYFCRKAREAGFCVWLDWGVSFNLQHLGQHANVIPTKQPEETTHAIIH